MLFEPSGPPGLPRRTLESKTTFVAHPSGTILGIFSVVFGVYFCYVFEEDSGAGIYCFWHHFGDILRGISYGFWNWVESVIFVTPPV